MTDAAITLSHVIRRFGSVVAVNGVSFEVRRGEIFGLLGHNGAGKTTLIRLMNGLLPPHGGAIVTLGLDPILQGQDVRQRTGVLTEYPALDHFLSPAENLAIYAAINGLDPRLGAARTEELLERLGLADYRDVPSHSLSAGLKQRVALARALVHEPELLLLDEPTSSLDPLAARHVRNLVIELTRDQGRTVLLSTHNLTEAQQLCDRIAIIGNGRLLAAGPIDELGRSVEAGAVEITVDPLDEATALATLRALPAADASPLADSGSLEARLTPSEVPNVVAALVAAGVRIKAVRPESPTLEDIYLSLHEMNGDVSPVGLAS